MQHRPGVRPSRRLLVIHVGSDGEADEQGGLVRVVVGQFDADREPLDDLHEVARGVLRRQQRQGLAGPHREAGDPALELLPAAVHVHFAPHPLADPQIGELGLLEVGVDPDFGERTDGHQALPDGDVVAGVNATAAYHAVDLADDVAIAEVQLGLGEVAHGLESLRLGLPDRGRLRHHPLQDPIDVPLLVAPGELLEGLLGRLRDGDEGEADLRQALVDIGQRLADPGERLVDVGGDVRQLNLLGVRGQAERDPRLMDFLEGLLDRGRRSSLGLEALVEVLAGERVTVDQGPGPLQVGAGSLEGRLLAPQGRDPGPEQRDRVVDVLDRPLELPAQAPGLGEGAPNLGPSSRQLGLGGDQGRLLDVDLNLVRLLVELDQQVPLLHPLVVVHQDAADLSGDTRRHVGHVAVDVGVIGGDRVQHRLHGRGQEVCPERQAGHGPRPQQRLPPGARRRHGRRGRRGRGGIGRHVRGPVVQMNRRSGRRRTRVIPRVRQCDPGTQRHCPVCGFKAALIGASHVGASPFSRSVKRRLTHSHGLLSVKLRRSRWCGPSIPAPRQRPLVGGQVNRR